MMMKVFLDDWRDCADDWVRVSRPSDVILLLETGMVREISLDHDLGTNKAWRGKYVIEETGYEVLEWIEQQVVWHGFVPPIMNVHTDNPPARKRMEAAIKSINDRVS
jgi:hypothetical protein